MAVKDEHKRKGHTPFYRFCYVVTWLVFHSLSPVRYHGGKALNRMAGPYLLICNHQSMLDPFIPALGLPARELTFLGKKELTRNRLLRWAVTKLHMIPVDRHAMDMEAMRACARALRNGEILLIFPEGTRHKPGIMADLESGTAMLALRSGVPLVPVLVLPKLRLFRRTECWYGRPIPTADLKEQGVNRETCDLLTRRITDTYAQMAAEPEKYLFTENDLPDAGEKV